MLSRIKSKLVSWLLKDAHIERLEVGKHTVSIDGNNITLPGTVDGVDISAHAANADAHHARSHDHSLAADGSPIALAGIPATLTGKDADTVDGQHRALTINADHTHQSTGAQGGTLDAAAIASGRFGVTRLNWTANKLLKGAGPGADPTEIDVPVGVTELDRMLGGLIYG
jgi:hypothetical protein